MPELTLANLIGNAASHSPAQSSESARSSRRAVEHRSGSEDQPRRRSNQSPEQDLPHKSTSGRQDQSNPAAGKKEAAGTKNQAQRADAKGQDGELKLRPKFRQMVEEILAGASAGSQQVPVAEANKAGKGQTPANIQPDLADGEIDSKVSLEESVARFLNRQGSPRRQQASEPVTGHATQTQSKAKPAAAPARIATTSQAPQADAAKAVKQQPAGEVAVQAGQTQVAQVAAVDGQAEVDASAVKQPAASSKAQQGSAEAAVKAVQIAPAKQASAQSTKEINPPAATTKQSQAADAGLKQAPAAPAKQADRINTSAPAQVAQTVDPRSQTTDRKQTPSTKSQQAADGPMGSDKARPANGPARMTRQARTDRAVKAQPRNVSTQGQASQTTDTDKPSALGDFLARARRAEANRQQGQADSPAAKPAASSARAAQPRPAGEDRYDIAARLQRQARTQMASRNQALQNGSHSRTAGMQDSQQGEASILTQPATAVEMPSPASAVGESIPAQPMPAQPSPVTEQIFSEISLQQNLVNKELTVQLNPRELGQVRIVFRQDGQEMVGQIRVENSQTLSELQREMPALIERLGQQGMAVRTIELEMNNDPSQNRGDAQNQTQNHDPHAMFGQSGQGRGERGEMTDGSHEPSFAPSAQVSDETVSPAGAGQYVSQTSLNVMI